MSDTSLTHGRALLHEQQLAELFDFRRSDRYEASAVRGVEAAHEVFGRRLASGWGRLLRGIFAIEHLSTEQVSYGDFLRALPNPDLLGLVAFDGLAAPIVVELDLGFGLRLLDRLLGGADADVATVAEVRRPTDLELALLRDVLDAAVAPLAEAVATMVEVTGELTAVETNPELVQIAAPSDAVLVLSFLVQAVQGVRGEGLLTLCYPSAALMPLLEALASATAADATAADPAWQAALVETAEETPVTLRVALADSKVTARDVAALDVGDVLRLDHRTDRPVRGLVGELEVIAAHPGRRGRRLAVQVVTACPDVLGAPRRRPDC